MVMWILTPCQVARNKGETHRAVFRRLDSPCWANLDNAPPKVEASAPAAALPKKAKEPKAKSAKKAKASQ